MIFSKFFLNMPQDSISFPVSFNSAAQMRFYLHDAITLSKLTWNSDLDLGLVWK